MFVSLYSALLGVMNYFLEMFFARWVQWFIEGFREYSISLFCNDFFSVSDVSLWTKQGRGCADEKVVVDELDSEIPHKIDENMWKNRENLEEIIYLLDSSHWPATVLTLLPLSVLNSLGIVYCVAQIKCLIEDLLIL